MIINKTSTSEDYNYGLNTTLDITYFESTNRNSIRSTQCFRPMKKIIGLENLGTSVIYIQLILPA